MNQTGVAELRLCSGTVPHYKQIVELSGPILSVLVDEFGTKEVIKRFSNPLWYSSLACALGFEWQFSGMTTVVLKAIKESLQFHDIGVKLAGGKGLASRQAPNEIINIGDKFNFNSKKIEDLKYSSKMSSKVDDVEIQDSYQIYFHTTIIDEKGNNSIINQGMNIDEQMVRRYHWLNPIQFAEEPHSSIAGPKQKIVLDLSAKQSRDCRKTIVDIVRDEKPEKIEKTLLLLKRDKSQKKIIDFASVKTKIIEIPYYLELPKRLNKKALEVAKQSENFEQIIATNGVGKSTMRGLAYVANLVYGSQTSWHDPVKFCYSYGTKAGKPWMVEKQAMSESAKILKQAVEEAKLGERQKLNMLKRLARFVEYEI